MIGVCSDNCKQETPTKDFFAAFSVSPSHTKAALRLLAFHRSHRRAQLKFPINLRPNVVPAAAEAASLNQLMNTQQRRRRPNKQFCACQRF